MLLKPNILAGLIVASLLAVVAFPLYAAFYLSPSFSRLVLESAQREAERTAAHLAGQFFGASGLIRPEEVTPAFRGAVVGDLQSFNIKKLKAFAPDGTIVFSTDPAEEGTVNNRPYSSEVVAAGRTYTSVVRKDGRTQEGRTVPVDVVETYVPVIRGGKFAGAFEIYLDITDRTAEVSRLLRRSNLIVFLVAGGFLAAVVISSLRAGKAVRERDSAAEALRGQRDRLDETVAERTVSLRESKEALEIDIARRVLAEEALRESEERALAIAGSSLDAIFVLDGAGRVSYLNRAAEEMYGYQREEVIGRVFHEVFVSEQARAHYERLLPEFKETGKCPVMGGCRPYTSRRRDGTEFPAEICIVPVKIRGEWHAVGTMRDIGERRRAEQERERLIGELTDALDNIKALRGIIPVCSSCKKIRDDKGYWTRLEEFLAVHGDVQVSQNVCPDCSRRLYPDAQPGEGPGMPLLPLSRREREVLAWLRHGKSNWEISRIVAISERTVKFHVASIMRKLNAVTRTQAVALAMELGILEDPAEPPSRADQT